MKHNKSSVKKIFDKWALDYHAEGMEKGHWKRVKQAFKLIPSSQENYLEIGIGNGYGIHYIARNQYKNGTCYGLDISSNMVKMAKQRTKNLNNIILQSDDFLTWKPPPDTKFSAIFSMETFYYFSDIKAGIEKAASLLTTGGILMILVDYYYENKESHSWPRDMDITLTLWKAEDYKKVFQEISLKKVKQKRLKDDSHKVGTLCTWGYKA
ncbi:MAG: class I SAM-dependent methyltransferase [bacterium]